MDSIGKQLVGIGLSAILAGTTPFHNGKAQTKIQPVDQPPGTADARVCYHEDEIPSAVKPILTDAWELTKEGYQDQANIAINDVSEDCVHIRHPEVIDWVKAHNDEPDETEQVIPDDILDKTYINPDELGSQHGLRSMLNGSPRQVRSGVQYIKRRTQAFEDDLLNNLMMSPAKNNTLWETARLAYRENMDTIRVSPYQAVTQLPDTQIDDARETIVKNVARLYAHEVGHTPFHLVHRSHWSRVSAYEGNDAGQCVNVMDDYTRRSRPADNKYGFKLSHVQGEIARKTVTGQGDYGTIQDESDAFDIYEDDYRYVSPFQYTCGFEQLVERQTK